MYQIKGGKQLHKVLETAFKSNLNVIISGSSGIGKSEIVYQVAAKVGLPVRECRLYLMDPGEAKGIPDVEGRRTIWTRPDWLPEEPCVLFFDDIHAVMDQLQAPLYELLLTRHLHGHPIPDEVRFVAAGNIGMASASAQEILAPIMARFHIAIEFEPEVNDFAAYISSTQAGPEKTKIAAFLLAYPEYLYEKDPAPSQMFPCPRTWMNLLKNLEAGFDISIATGTVGVTAGTKFIDIYPILGRTKKELMSDVPSNIKEQITLAAALARFDFDNDIAEFIRNNLSLEAQMLYFRSVVLMHPDKLLELIENPYITEAASEIVQLLQD